MSEALTGLQTRAARAIAGMSVRALAECAGVSDATIKRIESIDGLRKTTEYHILVAVRDRLERAISAKGWQFTPEGGISPIPKE